MKVPDIRSMTPSELAERLEQGRPFALVNVLLAEDWERRRIPDSLNACVFEVVFLDRMSEICPEKSMPVVVYGAGAATLDAPMAAEKLVHAGWNDVHILAGGLDAWAEAGLAVEGSHAGVSPEPEGLFEPAEGGYAVACAESLVEWIGRSAKGRHVGTARVTHGKMQVVDGSMDGLFEVDMRTIENLDLSGNETLRQLLHAHLASEDFFLTAHFPTATYVLDSATMLRDATPGRPNYEFHGRLEMRGVSHALSFPATIRPFDGDPETGLEPGFSVEAHFDLDRTMWGAVYGSGKFFRNLGFHLVYDLVSFQIRLVLR